MLTQPPSRTRPPRSLTSSAVRANKRVLPTPASPLTRTWRVSPASADAKAASICATASARPTSSALIIRRVMGLDDTGPMTPVDESRWCDRSSCRSRGQTADRRRILARLRSPLNRGDACAERDGRACRSRPSAARRLRSASARSWLIRSRAITVIWKSFIVLSRSGAARGVPRSRGTMGLKAASAHRQNPRFATPPTFIPCRSGIERYRPVWSPIPHHRDGHASRRGIYESPSEAAVIGLQPPARQTSPVRFLALACDFDGTIAHDGMVDLATLAALERVRASGRRLILVTGGSSPTCAGSSTDWTSSTASSPRTGPSSIGRSARGTARWLSRLTIGSWPTCASGVSSRSRWVVRSWRRGSPTTSVVLEAIRSLGLELQIVFNKGAVMVLPPGISKASGLMAALRELRLSPHNVVGVGDAENDHAFLALCELSAAVRNALPR